MRYITFFQFLRHCLLLDAEKRPSPQAILKNIGRTLSANGTKEVAQTDTTEQRRKF